MFICRFCIIIRNCHCVNGLPQKKTNKSVEDILLLWTLEPLPGIFRLFTLPLKIPDKNKASHLENLPKIMLHHTLRPQKFKGLKPKTPLEIPDDFFLIIPLEIPSTLFLINPWKIYLLFLQYLSGNFRYRSVWTLSKHRLELLCPFSV